MGVMNVIRTTSATIPFYSRRLRKQHEGKHVRTLNFYDRRRSNLGVSVLTTEVYRDSISYWNNIANISVNFRF